MGIPFNLEPLSVFDDFERIGKINPAVKVPTLITDSGIALMDSTLIINFIQQTCHYAAEIPLTTEESVRATGLG